MGQARERIVSLWTARRELESQQIAGQLGRRKHSEEEVRVDWTHQIRHSAALKPPLRMTLR